ncbi:hypothetical protein TELCIR_06723 [Teladorsagia circumcincta]|uniref:L-Fucosyltransferase n=1 Tax=Teladorsagia circumcincta TaxID=45464 RepID=A0A2G9UM77_TELCI|nr:hypothetical protein TELCIR_06723 [Teladorsagia circumcincta]
MLAVYEAAQDKPMSPFWKRLLKWAILLQCCLTIWFHTRLNRDTGEETIGTKYVGLHLNPGRMGNQLFHLINGYAIARTIGRVHYLPYENPSREVVVKYLKLFKRVFPALERTYLLDEDKINGTLVKFANNSCCTYDNPRRNGSRSSNDSLFWNRPYQNALCIHIRRTDFLELNISTNMMDTVYAANDIARGKGIERFVIFGDDREFMRNLSHVIIQKGNWRPDSFCMGRIMSVASKNVVDQ